MQKTSRLPLVLIPGLMDDEYVWQHQTQHLADISTPAVANIGHSASVAKLAESVLETAPPRFALCGFSLGGYVSLEIHRRAPQRIMRLALLATNARADAPARREARKKVIESVSRPGGYQTLVRADVAELVHPARNSEATLIDPLVEMALRVGPEVFVRQHKAAMDRPSGLEDLATIACPTLILCGRQDCITPPYMSEELAQGIKCSCYVVIEDAGHYISVERPQAVTALLRYWLLYL